MLLNALEKSMMNNPIRAAIQRYVEAQILKRMGGPLPGGRVLELGCGRGVGIEIILKGFGAKQVDAFDLDPEMIALAQKRMARLGKQVKLWVGDATAIQAKDNAYHAVFDFAIIHHIPKWRDALREVYRVLKPGGRFYAEEVLKQFIGNPVWRRFFDHPQEDRFDCKQFVAALRTIGFRIVAQRKLGESFAWVVAEK